MNERLSSRFAAVKKIVDELDYAGLREKDAAYDEYDGESILISLAACPALGVQANAVLFGFVFSYMFADAKPSQAWCHLAAQRLCAEVPARDDDPDDPVAAAQSIIMQLGLADAMEEMNAALEKSELDQSLIPHVVLRMVVLNSNLGL